MVHSRSNQSPSGIMPTGDPVEFTPEQTPIITTPNDMLLRQERERRKPLVRLIAVCILVISILLIPTGLIPALDPVTLAGVGLALVGGLVAYILNQIDHVVGSGIVLLVSIALAIAWEILAKVQVQGGIDLADLRLFDLFAILIVLSGVLIGRWGPLITGFAAMAFTLSTLVFLPHTEPLQQYWNGTYPFAIHGSSYDVVILALSVQALAACITWLGASSVEYALQNASRADDLQAANEQIRIQARTLAEQRSRLQDGIAEIQQVHAAVARGQWDARATTANSELLPVAISLNLLLDRLGRLTRDQETLIRANRAAHELAHALQRVRQGFPYMPPAYTGTPFDEVLVELAYLRTSRSPVNSQSRLAGYELRPDSRGRTIRRPPGSASGLPEDSSGLLAWQTPNLVDNEFDWPAWLRDQGEEGNLQSPPD
jgi:hypothetical protein